MVGQGVAAGIEHESVLRDLGCRTVVDVGANRGQFALAARSCFPRAKIIAFEPLLVPAARFKAVFAHDANVLLHTVALGQEPFVGVMHVSRRDDSSSLLPISRLQEDRFPGTAQSDLVQVSVRRLSDLVTANEIAWPALLKLDVQGYELQALLGCTQLLPCFTYVYAECSYQELYTGQVLADELSAWLFEQGFAQVGVHNQCYDANGALVQADALFARTNAVPT
jgi:FkbM family methyltransferase